MNGAQAVSSRATAGSLGCVAGLIVLSLVPEVAIALSAQETKPFVDELLVEEAAVVVDLSEAMSARELSQLKAKDLLVLESGQRREVTRLEAMEIEPPPADVPVFENVETCPWTFVVYIDTALSEPGTAFDSSLILGQRADALAEMGCVDIVIADPVPRVVVARSRSPEFIAKTLTDFAKRAREERDRNVVTPDSSLAVGVSDAGEVESQWDRLLTFMAGRRVRGPKALFLISDGFPLPVADLQILAGRGSGQAAASERRRLSDVVIDTAQTLSSYGWLTVPMPHVRGARVSPEPEGDDFDHWRDVAEGRVGSGEERTVINFFGTTRAGRPTGDLDARLFEAYLLPTLAPLRALAEATAGELVWDQGQLDEFLGNLGQRRLLRFQTTEPHDGRIRRLRVRLADSDTHLEAPWWKRSSTPHLVAESRLRRILAHEELEQSLEVAAEVLRDRNEGGSYPALRVRVKPVVFDGRASIGHVRISVGFPDPAGTASFNHRIDYQAPPLGGPWEYTLPLEAPADTVRLVLGVEDLNLEEWGATIIELEERGGDGRGDSS